MARVSNGVITCINFLTLLISFCAIGLSLWFSIITETPCQKILKLPLLIIGLSLLVVSLAGLAGSCCRLSFFMWLYLFVLFVLILGLTAFTVFTIVVTNKDIGRAFSNKGVGDTRLGDYSGWLQKHVINAKNWDQIKNCMYEGKLCQRIEAGKDEAFYKQNLSPIQSGCCKPPSYCGLQFQNATFWTTPKAGPAVPDPDCTAWSNVQTQLCFDCVSCKTAVLDDTKREWRTLAIINACVLLFVTIAYSIGCCALRNNQNYSYKYRGYA